MAQGSIKNSKDAERGKNTQFKKGKSGNPAGRPPKLPQLDILLAEVLGEEQNGLTAAGAILRAIRAKAIKGDVQAATVILDRAYGKAKQPVEVFNPDGKPIMFGYGPEKPV